MNIKLLSKGFVPTSQIFIYIIYKEEVLENKFEIAQHKNASSEFNAYTKYILLMYEQY